MRVRWPRMERHGHPGSRHDALRSNPSPTSYCWSRAPLRLRRNVEMPSQRDSDFDIHVPLFYGETSVPIAFPSEAIIGKCNKKARRIWKCGWPE